MRGASRGERNHSPARDQESKTADTEGAFVGGFEVGSSELQSQD
jgi:hypothetical protein